LGYAHSTKSTGLETSQTEGGINMSKDRLLETLLRYFRGCNNGDFELFKTAVAEDVTSYFVDTPPIHGRENLTQFFKMLYDMMKVRWTIDRTLIGEQEVVVEWSMLWTPPCAIEEEIDRGVDWLIFQDDLIAKVYQYYRPRNLPSDQPYKFQGFPYHDRNHPSRDDFASRIP
jgi:hypothetical protein